MTRTRRVESRRELERSLDDFLTRGYRIKNQSQYTARVKEKDYGDVPVHGFLFLFVLLAGAVTFDAAGLPAGGVWLLAIGANVAYVVYSWFTAEEVIITVAEDGID